jgi:hypothetical protein
MFLKKSSCNCDSCDRCKNKSYDYELLPDDSGVMTIEFLDSKDEEIRRMMKGLSEILPSMNVEEIVLLNNLREASGLIKVAAKHKPNNPKLWAKCLADARRRFDVCPSAYCNAFAAKTYKKKGGTWKTVKKSGGKK